MPSGTRAGSAWYELSADDSKLRADLARAESELQQAGVAGERNFAQPIERGADRAGDAIIAMSRSVSGISGTNATELATALDRAQREATEALAALRSLSTADLDEEEARRYADAVNDIESEAQVTASELRELQRAQPEFDTPELRQAATSLDIVGDEANQLGNEFRELARANPDATLAKAARESRNLATGMDTAARRSDGLMTKLRGVQNLLIGLGLAIGAQQVLSFFNDAITAASDLGETVSKASQIFGAEAIPALEEWASVSATAFGQSKQQALDGAATFAIFGKSAGLAGDDLVGFSTELVELSSDLASFANTSPEEAITAIGAALRGESEPIRRYGVLLDEATLRQRALTLGIIDNIKTALTPQQRVLAAQAEIFAQTSDAQGDFMRTSEGLANQQRIQAAKLQDAMVRLGEALLPLALAFTTFAADAIPAVIDALKGVLDVMIPLGGVLVEHADVIIPALAAVMGVKLVGALRAMITAQKVARAEAIATGTAFKGMGLAAKAAWGTALIGLPFLIEGLEAGQDAANDFFTELLKGKDAAKTIGDLEDALGDQPFARAMADQLQELGVTTEEWAAVTEAAGGDVMVAFQAVKDAAGDTDVALRTLTAVGTAMSQTWADAWTNSGRLVESQFGTTLQRFGGHTEALAEAAEESVSGLAPAMQRAVADLLAEAKEVPEGVSVTLANGKTIVAGSMEELAAILPRAIRKANREVYVEALKTPGEISDAILAGKDELKPIHDAIVDALVNGVSDARVRAANEAELFGPALRKGLRAKGMTDAQAKDLVNAEALVESILAVEPDIFDAGQKMPPAIARGYLRTRESVIQAVRDINEDQTLTAAEVVTYLEQAGQDGLAALIEGIKSKQGDAERAQQDINDAIVRRAAGLANPMLVEGVNAGRLFGDGIDAPGNQSNAADAGSRLANSAKAQLLFDAFGIGRGVGASYGDGIAAGIDTRTWLISGKVDGISRMLGFAGSPMFTHSRELGEGVSASYGDALSNGLQRLIASLPSKISGLGEVLGAAVSSASFAPLQIAPAVVQTALAPAAAPAFQAAAVAQPPIVQEVHHHNHLEVRGFIPEPTTPADIRREMRRLSLFTD